MTGPNAAILQAEQFIADFAVRVGHEIGNRELFVAALTHPSAVGMLPAVGASYERLEFLGDRVLGLIVAHLLYERFPQEAEGALARRLAALVRRDALAEVALEIGLDEGVLLAKGEREAGEARNPAILSDVCEALIAALYLDGGLQAARRFIEPAWLPLLAADPKPPQDAKTQLQEWAQARGLALPRYREVARVGPPHEPVFSIEVSVEGHPPAAAEGRSKRLAEQSAAQSLLEAIGKHPS